MHDTTEVMKSTEGTQDKDIIPKIMREKHFNALCEGL